MSPGEIDRFFGEYAFLSNFYAAKVKWEGIVYPTVEHAFQAAKTHHHESRLRIARMDSPAEAKRVGRTLHLREDWEDVKLLLMLRLLEQKFTVHEELRVKLIATAPKKLVEGNTWGDTFWGVCDGVGHNELGKALMKVRESLIRLAGRTRAEQLPV